MVDIIWSGAEPEDTEFASPFAVRNTCIAREWADSAANAESAVQDLIEDWIDDDWWEGQFGMDNTSGDVLIEIHEPPSIAGRYEVELQRPVKARAKKVEKF